MINRKHYEHQRIEEILDNLNRAWKELNDLVKEKSSKLAQAADRKDIIRAIDDANLRLDEIERQLSQNEQGNDLRSVKELIQKKSNLDQDITILENKITEISSTITCVNVRSGA